MRAVVSRDEPEPHEVGEELPRLLAKHDAREARILAHDADAGVACDEHQEASLAVGESALRDRLNRVLEIHRNNSSAMRGSKRPTAASAVGAGRDAEAARPAAAAATRPSSADHARSAGAVTTESRRRLGAGVSATVVQRLNLDVERAEVPVAVLVLDARVRKLDVAVVVRELVLDGPTIDLLGRSIGPSIAF